MEFVDKFKNYLNEPDEGTEYEEDEIIYEEVEYEEKPKKVGVKAYLFGLIGAICGAATIAAQFVMPGLCAILDWGNLIFSVIGLFYDTNKKYARLGLILAAVRVVCGIAFIAFGVILAVGFFLLGALAALPAFL